MLVFGFRGERTTRPDLIGVVRPNTLNTISDLSDGRRALMIMHCYPDDSGGAVYRVFDETLDLEPAEGPIALPREFLAEENTILQIGRTEYRERRMVTVGGVAAYLAIQHVPGETLSGPAYSA